MEHTLALIEKAHEGDKAARDTLAEENMGLVWSMVRRFANRGVEMEDLCQIGSIGLLKAIDKFDPSFEVCFSTYAVPMIAGEIRRFLRDNNALRVSRSLRDTAYRAMQSREELENKIATLTGGRVAEDLVFHSITTGASNDIEQATKVARSMITRFGMNEEFGMVAFETVTNQYLGGDTSLACSESTAAQIDEKVVAAVRKQYDKAEQLLKDNMPKLHELAKYLYEKETITGDEFMEILNLSPDQLTTTRMETN